MIVGPPYKTMYSLKCETISIYAYVPAQEDLTIKSYVHDLSNVTGSLYIKLLGQTMSHLHVEIETCS